MLRRFALCILVPLYLGGWLFSQETQKNPPADKSQEPFKIGVEVNLVNLPVNARLASGGFAKGLKQEDFKVFEDGVEQEIVLFQPESVPVHVALLIDISGSVENEWGTIRTAARRFAAALSPKDQVAVVTFNMVPRLVLDWTEQANLVDKALGKVLPKGSTALFDAVYVAFDDLFKGVEGKKAVILLTDGFDNTSKVKYEEALDLAMHSEAMVYVVSETEVLRATMEYYKRKENVQIDVDAGDFAAADSILKNLSYQTGGRVLYPTNFGELGNVYAEVAQELANQYAIGYIPHNRVKDGGYRAVSIACSNPEVRVSTRPGYYAPKAAAAY